MLVKLCAAFCFAFFVQTAASPDLEACPASSTSSDLETCPASSTSSDLETCPASSTPEPTCSLLRHVQTCQCDCNNADCDTRRRALIPCGYVVYYGEQKDMTFCRDDAFYQARCKDQLDCAETIQCFITCCLQTRGAEFMRRLIRSAQFEVLDLCHPNADPEFQEEFKDRTDCNNAIWRTIYKCVIEVTRNFTAVVSKQGVDIPRFCCTFHYFRDCFYGASKVECCKPKQQLYFKSLVPKYCGEIYNFLCTGQHYGTESPTCKCLTPLDQREPPPVTFLGSLINIAVALTNSSNEKCS